MQHKATPGTTEVADMFAALVRTRRSTRAFLPEPVPVETIVSVLEDAQQTPSNCNTQPWDVHVVSGKSLERLSAAMQDANAAGERTLDFTFDASVFPGPYGERSRAQGA